jgi:hypothetical protein
MVDRYFLVVEEMGLVDVVAVMASVVVAEGSSMIGGFTLNARMMQEIWNKTLSCVILLLVLKKCWT